MYMNMLLDNNSIKKIFDYVMNLGNEYLYDSWQIVNHNALPNYNDVNFYKKENNFVLEVLMPGISNEEIEVVVENNILRISSLKKNNEQTEQNNRSTNGRKNFLKGFSVKENFDLRFTMMEDTEIESAELKNGILKITFKENKESKGIKINVV